MKSCNIFFYANGIEEPERKRAILLSSVGSQTYSLIRNLLSPAKPGDKSYDDLVNLFKEHFNPKPNEIALRKIASDCQYGDRLTEMLRDRVVCGIGEEKIQRLYFQ